MGRTTSESRSTSRKRDETHGSVINSSKKIQKQPKNTDKNKTSKAAAGKKGAKARSALTKQDKTNSKSEEKRSKSTSKRKQVTPKEPAKEPAKSQDPHANAKGGRTGVTGIKITRGSAMTGYTGQQHAQYKKLFAEMKDLTNHELQEMLRKNEQTMTGTKVELASKVADGKVLGRIPKCPNCKEGRPKFDYRTGTYLCPGYRDGEDHHTCLKRFTMEQLPREKWRD